MGVYERQILPRFIDLMLGGHHMDDVRRPALEGLHGEVLELGFGSGPNVPLYPAEVDRVYAVDPSLIGMKLAAKRIERSSVPIEFVGLDGERLPLDDESVDGVLSTWTLCTIPDVAAAMQEVRRVLRPGGTLHFLEHGLSDDAKIAKRQHQFTPLQRKVAGGCHLDRDIDAIVRASGLHLDRLSRFTIKGPKTSGSMYCGVARKP